jgi:WD40 repeat protein
LVVGIVVLGSLVFILLVRSNIGNQPAPETPPTDYKRTVTAAAMSNDATYIIRGYNDGVMSLMRPESQNRFDQKNQHVSEIYSIRISPNNDAILSSSRDGKVLLWEINQRQQMVLQQQLNRQRVQLWGIAFSPNGQRVAWGGQKPNLTVYDRTSQETVYKIEGWGFWFDRLEFSPDGTMIASCSDGNSTVAVWDLKRETALYYLMGHSQGVISLAWSADSKRVAAGGSEDNAVLVWELPEPSDETQVVAYSQAMQNIPSPIHHLTFIEDGELLVAPDANEIWHVEFDPTDRLTEDSPTTATTFTKSVVQKTKAPGEQVLFLPADTSADRPEPEAWAIDAVGDYYQFSIK